MAFIKGGGPMKVQSLCLCSTGESSTGRQDVTKYSLLNKKMRMINSALWCFNRHGWL